MRIAKIIGTKARRRIVYIHNHCMLQHITRETPNQEKYKKILRCALREVECIIEILAFGKFWITIKRYIIWDGLKNSPEKNTPEKEQNRFIECLQYLWSGLCRGQTNVLVLLASFLFAVAMVVFLGFNSIL